MAILFLRLNDPIREASLRLTLSLICHLPDRRDGQEVANIFQQ
jgi:hypothetical protein